MNSGKWTRYHLLFALAVLLALALRFIGLGRNPLSDAEAANALQAVSVFQNGQGLGGVQPLYGVLTGLVFFLFGASEFWARFWPALLGVLLLWAPHLARERLGQKAALMMAAALAVEPSLVAASRQADGRMLAITAMGLAVVFLLRERFSWGGVLLGLSLLGGPTAWYGLLACLLAWVVVRPTRHIAAWKLPREFWVGLGISLLLAGSLFWFLPGGLSSFAGSFLAALQGWSEKSGVPLAALVAAWVGLSPWVFLFGVTRLATLARRDNLMERWLAVTWACLLLWVFIYPQRQAVDLAWTAAPLAALAASQAARMFSASEFKIPVAAYAALVVILLISLGINYSALVGVAPFADAVSRWGGLLGGVLLLLASFGLVVWGWSVQTAYGGTLIGVSLFLALYSLSTAWAAAGQARYPEMEVWVNTPYPLQQPLTLKVLGDVSEWNTGRRDWIEVVVSGIDTPSLRWGLRNFPNARFVDVLQPESTPAVVITPEIQAAGPGLKSAYTGQGIDWGHTVNWRLFAPSEWLRWMVFREVPILSGLTSNESVIVWLRSDLFLGARNSPARP